MRIISGLFRGKHIHAPGHLPVRPTTDFAKTGLFNILSNRYRFPDIRVADLFAGTGNLSYEFVSRGCSELYAVDNHPGCVRFIRDTFTLLKCGNKAQAVQADALSWLKVQKTPFDIVFADAPFAETPAAELVDAVLKYELIAAGGCLIIEHEVSHECSHLPGFQETRKYGTVCFSFFNPPSPQQLL